MRRELRAEDMNMVNGGHIVAHAIGNNNASVVLMHRSGQRLLPSEVTYGNQIKKLINKYRCPFIADTTLGASYEEVEMAAKINKYLAVMGWM